MAVTYNSKQIVQVDIDTGEYIDTYSSIRDAADDNYCAVSSLSRAIKRCDGRLTQLGLRFITKDEYDKIKNNER